MTDLEAIKTAEKHLLEQGQKSVSDDTETCLYRGSNGTRCGVGWLIPDEKYSPDMEGKSCGQHPVVEVLEELGLNITVCHRIQTVHDCYEPGDWKRHFAALKKEYQNR